MEGKCSFVCVHVCFSVVNGLVDCFIIPDHIRSMSESRPLNAQSSVMMFRHVSRFYVLFSKNTILTNNFLLWNGRNESLNWKEWALVLSAPMIRTIEGLACPVQHALDTMSFHNDGCWFFFPYSSMNTLVHKDKVHTSINYLHKFSFTIFLNNFIIFKFLYFFILRCNRDKQKQQ